MAGFPGAPFPTLMTGVREELKQLPRLHEWKPQVDLGRVMSALHLPALNCLTPKGEIIIIIKPLREKFNFKYCKLA